jgi:hypothetical protein
MRLARAARARLSSDTSHTIRAGNRIQLIPFHQFSWWNKYQIDPVWSASLLGFVRVVRRQRLPAGLPALRRRRLRADRRELEGAAQYREHLQQGLLGLGGGQQQHLAGQPRTFRLKVREGAAGPSQRPSRVATFAAAELRSEQGGSKLGK